MTRKLTHEEFLNKFYEKNKHANDIEILGTYIKTRTKVKCKCKIDGHEWETTPFSLLQGHGCPKCGTKMNAQKQSITHEEFMKRLHQVNSNIQVLGTYKNNRTKIKCKCALCEYEWTSRPNDLLRGHGCPQCAGNIKSTTEEFINKLQQINSDIEILGTYKNAVNKIKCRCKVCEHEWTTKPNSLLCGHGCPKCSISKGEKRIAQYLDNLDIAYIYNMGYFNDLVSVNGGLMRPDFIIPSLKIWIEYDGIQHSEPVNFRGGVSEQQLQANFKLVQQNDQIKNQYAKDNNWTLIRISFTEYDNIEQILAEYIEQEKQVI